jgi:hypothetical protein
MTTQIRPIAELHKRGTEALIRELGVVDTVRYLNQFRAGSGDYLIDRPASLVDLTVDQIAAAIRDSAKLDQQKN